MDDDKKEKDSEASGDKGESEVSEESKEEKADSVGTEKKAEAFQIYAGPRGSRKKIPFLLGIIIIILILGGIFYILRGKGETKPEAEKTSLPAVTVEEPLPQPSPSPSFERSKYILRVLNGTKINGLAASTSAKLENLGYSVERVGNATDSAFPKTVVRVKRDLEALLENLLKDLRNINFAPLEGPQLQDSDTSEGEVILGAE